MDFICKALFKEGEHEDWETEFLQRRLLSDGLIEFKKERRFRFARNNRFGNKVYPKWRLYKRTFKQKNRRGVENTDSQKC